ncbi:MAG TPA: ABC transporter substrate-binding protein [Stellaceae bacterium]|jgi:ABC-type nitrate/sulfonate/bicarbonate transport system substrate-binding protein|nr:ABC transporter substrate-binding protein [Stellaceae bacterium]
MRFLVAILCIFLFGASLAHADDKLRVGKAVAGPFDFVPLDIGMDKGFFKAHGVDVEEVDFDGSAKLQQGLGANAVDVGLGSGPELAFVAKGNTDLAIAVFAGPPNSQVLVVSKNSGVHSVADLKGKKVGLSTVGSLTDWLLRQLSTQQGWGADGIQGVALGSESGRTASLRAGSTDGMVIDVATATKFAKESGGTIVVHFGTVAPDFIIHAIFATNAAIANQPDVLKRFLAGWFETINWMRGHRDETVALAAKAMHQDTDIVAANYDQTMNDFSTTGRFDAKALAVLGQSFVDMKTLPSAPDMAKLYTEKLLP